PLPDGLRFGEHVVPQHSRVAGIGAQQGREHPDHGGLTGPVGSEHAVDAAAADLQVDAVDGDRVAELLHQRLGLDCHLRFGHALGPSGSASYRWRHGTVLRAARQGRPVQTFSPRADRLRSPRDCHGSAMTALACEPLGYSWSAPVSLIVGTTSLTCWAWSVVVTRSASGVST